MIDINDDELERLYGKLEMLSNCLRIRALGYCYYEGTYITIDPRAEDGGYGGFDQIEFLVGVLGSSIGEGCCDTNEALRDELISIGAKIPYSTYDSDCINGVTLKIDNDVISKFHKYGLMTKEFVHESVQSIEDECCLCEESTVTNIQMIYNSYLYIVVPEEYFAIECFFSAYCSILERIHKEVEEYEKEMNKVEVA